MPFLEKEKDNVIYYDIFGKKGPTIILLNGLSRSSQHWFGFEHLLAQSFRVVVLDFTNIGQSKGRSFWGMKLFDLEMDVLAVMDHLDIQKAHLLGLSLGGMLAMQMGFHYPQRILSIIAINSSIGGLGGLRLMPYACLRLFAGLFFKKKIYDIMLETYVGKDLSPFKKRKIKNFWKTYDERNGIPYETIFKHLFAAMQFHINDGIHKLDIPLTLIIGTKDQFVSSKNSERLSNILTHCKMIYMPSAGHEIPIHEPTLLKKIVDAQIASVSF